MPKGFTSIGQTILTKDEFLEAFLTSRGYEKNVNGEWELIYPELNTPTETTKIEKTTKKVATSTKTDKSKPIKTTATTGLIKEKVIENINKLFDDNGYKYTLEKTTFLVILGNEKYELKTVKKATAFEFDDDFDSVKDYGKQRLIKSLLTLDFANNGVIDTKGTVGFTDSNEYVTVTITKKRK